MKMQVNSCNFQKEKKNTLTASPMSKFPPYHFLSLSTTQFSPQPSNKIELEKKKKTELKRKFQTSKHLLSNFPWPWSGFLHHRSSSLLLPTTALSSSSLPSNAGSSFASNALPRRFPSRMRSPPPLRLAMAVAASADRRLFPRKMYRKLSVDFVSILILLLFYFTFFFPLVRHLVEEMRITKHKKHKISEISWTRMKIWQIFKANFQYAKK